MTRFIILMIACLGLAGCGDDDRTATDVINSSSSSEEYSSEQDPDEESGNQSAKTDMASWNFHLGFGKLFLSISQSLFWQNKRFTGLTYAKAFKSFQHSGQSSTLNKRYQLRMKCIRR